MTPAEVKELERELTEGKFLQMAQGAGDRTLDQPIRVEPFSAKPPAQATGYFTQQKYIWGKTPAEMERILGIFGKLSHGAVVLQFGAPLNQSDYLNKAYSYLPGGEEYKPNPKEKVFLPGNGVPQWKLTRAVPAKCIAILRPGQSFDRKSLIV